MSGRPSEAISALSASKTISLKYSCSEVVGNQQSSHRQAPVDNHQATIKPSSSHHQAIIKPSSAKCFKWRFMKTCSISLT
eukprot:2104751-Prymnesium_polylepis.2